MPHVSRLRLAAAVAATACTLAFSAATAQTPRRPGCDPTALGTDPATLAAQPDLDPCWDWTVPRSYTLRFPGGEVTVPLPFHQPTLSCPFRDPPDVDPADGWRLLYRAFGSDDRPETLPKLALYNRRTGMLRYFVFVAPGPAQENFTRGAVRLALEPGSQNPALLALARTPKRFEPAAVLDDFDGDTELMTTVRLAIGQWSCATFWLVGYDPYADHNRNVTLTVSVEGIDETSLSPPGGDMGTKMFSAGGDDDEASDLEKRYEEAVDTYGSFDETVTKITKWVGEQQNPASGGPAPGALSAATAAAEVLGSAGEESVGTETGPLDQLTEFLGELADSGVVKALPVVSAVVSFFIGADDEASNAMSLANTPRLEGLLTTRNVLGEGLVLRLPGTVDNQRLTREPLYDEPLGVFNLVAKPKVEGLALWSRRSRNTFEPATGEAQVCTRVLVNRDLLRLSEPLRYVLNPAAGLRIRRIEAAWPSDLGVVPPSSWVPLEQLNREPVQATVHFQRQETCRSPSLAEPLVSVPAPLERPLALRVLLDPIDGGDPVTVVRRYPTTIESVVPVGTMSLVAARKLLSQVDEELTRPLPPTFRIDRQPASTNPSFKAAGLMDVTPEDPIRIESGASWRIESGRAVRFGPGFRVDPGAALEVVIADPSATAARCDPCTSPPER